MTKTMNAPFSLGLLLVLMTSGATAAAQTASSFEQLALFVESGGRVTVTDNSDRQQTGRIVDLTPSRLVLLGDGSRHEFRAEQVHTIHQWRGDSLKNGALIGAFIGAGAMLHFAGRYVASRDGAICLGLSVAAGAGIGVGLDALVRGRQVTIYRSSGTARSVTVAPLVARNRRGLAVAFGF